MFEGTAQRGGKGRTWNPRRRGRRGQLALGRLLGEELAQPGRLVLVFVNWDEVKYGETLLHFRKEERMIQ